MWNSFTGLFGAKKKGEPGSPYGSPGLSGETSDRYAQGGPDEAGHHQDGPVSWTYVVHFVFADDMHNDGVVTLANTLSREFGFGLDAVPVTNSAELTEALGMSPALRALHERPPGEDDGPRELSPETLAKILVDDVPALHRWLLRWNPSARTLHHVLRAPKALLSNLIPALHGQSVRVPTTTAGQLVDAPIRTGVVVVAHESLVGGGTRFESPQHTATAEEAVVSPDLAGGGDRGAYHSDPEDDDDGDDDGTLRDHFSVGPRDVAESERLASVYERVRSRVIALSASLAVAGASAVSFDSGRSSGGGGNDAHELASAPFSTCSSIWELRRLRSEQVRLLKVVASNLNRVNDNAVYGAVNARSGRFYQEIGRYPAAMRVLRNLGFSSVDEQGTLTFAGNSNIAAGIWRRDRERFLRYLEANGF